MVILNSLRTRLTLIFVALTIIPLLVVGFLITSRGSNTLQEQSVHFQDEVAQRTAINLQSFFRERQAELFALTDIYGLNTLTAETQRDVLLTLLSKQQAYYQLALVGSTGQETIRVTRGVVVTDKNLANRADDALFKAAVESRQINYGEVYFNEIARDRLITVAVPMEDLFTGEIANVLIAEVRFQNVGDAVLRALDLEPSEDVFIVDSEGVIIAHRNPNLVISPTVFALPEKEGRTTGLDGDDVILADYALSLANQEVIVVAETEYSAATSLATDLSQLAALITGATLILAVAIITWSAGRVVNPIINMSRVAKAVQKGDLSARASEQGDDEIAVLGSAFNQMTSELQKSLEGLQHNVQQLEASNLEREKLIRDLEGAKRIAEENSRLKSEFLATMSHELRTPLNAIEGFTSIMLKRMAGTDYNEKTGRYLTKVESNSKRLLGLINDFLDLSRIESGRMDLAYLPFGIREAAQKWRDSLSGLAEEKQLAFEVEVAPDLPTTMYGDEETLTKIVVNLVGNAVKFTESGSVAVAVNRRDSQFELTVKDTGIGIPAHARELIFDEFRQVDQSSKRKYGGTGLGLAIVQKLARAMGGTVSVQSQVGVGSTFTVLLPIHEQQEKASA